MNIQRLFKLVFIFLLSHSAFAQSPLEVALQNEPGYLGLFLYAHVLDSEMQHHPENKAVVSQFLTAWQTQLQENRADHVKANDSILNELLAKPEFKLIKHMLRWNFQNEEMGVLESFRRLDGISPSRSRVIRALNSALVFARFSRHRAVAVGVANAFIESKDTEILAAAKKLLEESAKGYRQEGKFDLLALENFVGAGLARQLVFKSGLKAGEAIKGLSTVTKSFFVSGAAHVGLGAAALREGGDPSTGKLNVAPLPKTIPQALTQSTNERRNLVAREALVKQVESLMAGWQNRRKELADQIAELVFTGELIEHFNKRVKLSERVIEGVWDFSLIANYRQRITKDFDEYMKRRGLNQMDAEAMSYLRSLLAVVTPLYEEGQQMWLPTLLGGRGNCVARAMLSLAFYYPLYLKYKPARMELGVQLWTDHVEAVLYNPDSQVAISLLTMQPIARNKMVDILYPEVLFASYLARRSKGKVPTRDSLVLCYKDKPCTGAVAGLKRFWNQSIAEATIQVTQTEREQDDLVNFSPFFAHFYTDPMIYSEDGPPRQDGLSILDPNTKLDDFVNGKDIAPQESDKKAPPKPQDDSSLKVKVVRFKQTSLFPVLGKYGQPKSTLFISLERPEEITELVTRALPHDWLENLNRKVVRSILNSETGILNDGMIQHIEELERATNSEFPRDGGSVRRGEADTETQGNLDNRRAIRSRQQGSAETKVTPAKLGKFLASRGCEILQKETVRQIGEGDTTAISRLTTSEATALSNMIELIRFSQNVKGEWANAFIYMHRSWRTCGHDPVHKALWKWGKELELDKNDKFRAWLLSLNEKTRDQVRQEVTLIRYEFENSHSPENYVRGLQVKLNRHLLEPEQKSTQASGSGAQAVSSERGRRIEIILMNVVTPPNREEHQGQSTKLVSHEIELRPDVFWELISNVKPAFSDEDFAGWLPALWDLKLSEVKDLTKTTAFDVNHEVEVRNGIARLYKKTRLAEEGSKNLQDNKPNSRGGLIDFEESVTTPLAAAYGSYNRMLRDPHLVNSWGKTNYQIEEILSRGFEY